MRELLYKSQIAKRFNSFDHKPNYGGEVTAVVIGVCGISTDVCPLYKKSICKGCPAITGVPEEPMCPIARCAREKGVKLCSECSDFICEKLEFVYSKPYIETLKSRT